jgi:hypothetical protein
MSPGTVLSAQHVIIAQDDRISRIGAFVDLREASGDKGVVLGMRLPLRKAIAVEIIILMVGGALVLPGGEDMYRFYLPIAQGCPQCGYNPWYTSWILFPIQFIPPRLLWAIWVLLTGVIVFWAAERLHTNSALVLLSFPMMGQMWLGQTDAVVILGLMLVLLSPSPYLRGMGILLASIKPQVAGPALLILWWYDQARWKTLIIPSVIFLLSLVVWNIDWPIQWWLGREVPGTIGPPNVWVMAPLTPYGILSFLSILVIKDKRRKVVAMLIASALCIPRFGVYSYIVFMIFINPWWALPLSYAWAAAYPWLGAAAMRFAWILPLGLLVYLILPEIKELRSRITTAPTEDPG